MDVVKYLENVELFALLSRNNLIITFYYTKSFTEIKCAIIKGKISEIYIYELIFKMLAWKYYNGIMNVEGEK